MVPVKRAQIIARLEEHRIPFTELHLQNGVTILVSQLGGRVYGPFLNPGSDSIYWVPPIFEDARAFSNYLAQGWNFGGERFWIAPEIQYLVKDRTDYFGSLFVPPAMDPGNWKLDKINSGGCHLRQELTMQAYNLASGTKSLQIEVTFARTDNPLRHLESYDELMAGVTYAGYEQTVLLREGSRDDIFSATWNLIMLNPGGEVLIPCTPSAEITCYKGTLNQQVLEQNRHSICLRITGDQMYKAGLKAAHTFGRMAYLNRNRTGEPYLLIRCFTFLPGSEYPEEPPDIPGRRGDVIHVYNDDGSFGDMGEIECSGQTIGSLSGRSESIDTFALYLYAGPIDRLRKIVSEILGIDS